MIGRLVIRADASLDIGVGHVMRMIALGQAWQEAGGSVLFVGNFEPLVERLISEGFEIAMIESGADVQALAAHVDSTDRIVVDGYEFHTGFQKEVYRLGSVTVVLDDTNDRGEYCADILLNQNADGGAYVYTLNEGATVLCGSQYALLRREFVQRPVTRVAAQGAARKILVTMGGGDSQNVTGRVLSALRGVVGASSHIKVVVGAVNPRLAELKEQAARLECVCDILHDTSDMAPLMEWAELAVGAAGSTCWELCYFGVPLVVSAVADNQQGVCNALRNSGGAVAFDMAASTDDLAALLATVVSDADRRNEMAHAVMRQVDGRGAARVAGALITHGMRLRPAVHDDWETILRWRNHPVVRAQSFVDEKILPEPHRKWLAGRLADENCLFLLAEDVNGVAIGQVRFDVAEGEGVVSVVVAPELNGMGIGTKLMSMGCALFRKRWPSLPVVALVKRGNPASLSMFKKVGFERDCEQGRDQLDSVRFVWW